MSQPESLLRRWSRLKLQSPPDTAAAPPAAAPLPQADSLGFDSDFSAFLHPDVDRKTRTQALRKLFMTDHYRAMDGLDVYVEDYSRPALLPLAWLDKLDHARDLLAPAAVPEAGAAPAEEAARAAPADDSDASGGGAAAHAPEAPQS